MNDNKSKTLLEVAQDVRREHQEQKKTEKPKVISCESESRTESSEDSNTSDMADPKIDLDN